MVKSSKEDILEKEDILDLVQACKSDRDRLTIITLIYTGMRVSEFCHMKKDWINWQRKIIRIPSHQSCDCADCKKQGGIWKPKTKAGIRSIPIREKILRDTLSAWFVLHDDVPFVRSSAFRRVKNIAARTHIQKSVYPHSIRATYATNLSHKGFSPTTIMNVMGWEKLATAESYIRGSAVRTMEEFEEKW